MVLEQQRQRHRALDCDEPKEKGDAENEEEKLDQVEEKKPSFLFLLLLQQMTFFVPPPSLSCGEKSSSFLAAVASPGPSFVDFALVSRWGGWQLHGQLMLL